MRLKGILALIIGLLLAASAGARQRASDTAWYSMRYKYPADTVTTKDSAEYFLAILPANSTGNYPVLKYDKKHTLTSSGFSATANPNKIAYTGEFTTYADDGKKTAVAEYSEGKLSGKMLQYYPNGKLYTYRIHPKNGHILLIECRDSTGNALAKDGNGKWVVYMGDFRTVGEEGTVKDSVEEGKWKATITDAGNYTTVYNHGQKVSVSDAHLYTSHDDIFGEVALEPYFEGDFGKYLSKNIRYPKYAKDHNIQGKVFVEFVVEKDGGLNDIKILRSPDQTLSDEALRVMNSCPKWHPGYQNDRPVRVMYTIPIGFNLNSDK